ncbi:MAG: hypothetical protein MUO53_07755 [Maribacter sp.]|nr:hypothetical protein [Maribacter sp.]
MFRYILTPLFYLFKIKKGITNKQASLLIGRHFTEVDDKLYNLLDLAEDTQRSELLLASIEQRSENLEPIPFVNAIDLRESFKYAKYLSIPLLIFMALWLSGNLKTFFGSYDRVVNYGVAYEAPAPFTFKLLTNSLDVLDNQSYTIQVITEGSLRPRDVFMNIDGTDFILQEQNNIYNYTFSPPVKNTDFYFMANGIKSKRYHLNVLRTPSIQNFQLVLEYPNYINRASETLKSTGNAVFPEGTKVTWKIEGENTKDIDLVSTDTILSFSNDNGKFNLSKRIFSNFPYQISTSNENVKAYEKLDYELRVVKDAYPGIRVEQVLDSIDPNISYYIGEASDDYQVATIRLVCYSERNQNERQIIEIGNPATNFYQFYYTFPSGLTLTAGEPYSFYFEVIDNDAIHNRKHTKSRIFSTSLMNEDELRNRDLDLQESIIGEMDRSLIKLKEQKETLNEINTGQKEKSQMNFNDQNQIKDFLKKQEQQETLMKRFSKELKENLDKDEKDQERSALLKERLERQEIEAEKNRKLLEELNKIAAKIDKEELARRLEELGKKQQNRERNLEQLLELTKRYYVTEKASQLAKDLDKLGEKEEILSELKIGKDFSDKEQEKINQKFKEIAEELEELSKDNENLKKPLAIEVDKAKSESIKKDHKDALEEINKHQGIEQSSNTGGRQENADKAKQKQKSAAQKIKEMSEELQQAAAGGSSDEVEDAEMLRQILDNLLIFSFKQEKLFSDLGKTDPDISQFSGNVREQQELRNLFEHVDDSLFALSLRRAELSEFVNEQITEIYYNIDKSLESNTEDQFYQAISHQKYVLNASNALSDFLANILDNMQQNMQMGKGQGGGDFQLPDIIQGQGELQEKMNSMGKAGKGSTGAEKGEDQKGSQGEKGEGNAENGKTGQAGAEGKGGEGNEKLNGVGESKGKGGDSKQGQGNEGYSEEELKEIFEIYKTQQLLREQLEQQLQDMIEANDRDLGKKLLQQMEDFENDLLQNGITQQNIAKINTIQYQLLKLENATLEQGKKPQRQSKANKDGFDNPITTKPLLLENYRNEIEILNRQALPLRQKYQNKVKEYFKSDDRVPY